MFVIVYDKNQFYKIDEYDKTKDEILDAIKNYENKDYSFEIIEDEKLITIIQYYLKKVKDNLYSNKRLRQEYHQMVGMAVFQ